MSVPAEMIARARSVPIERVIDAHGIKLRGRVERVGACPICGGDDRFGVNIKKGLFLCRRCGSKGDTIALERFITGASFAEAVERLSGGATLIGYVYAPARAAASQWPAKADDDESAKLSAAARIWEQATPLTEGDPGWQYLTGRGIALDQVPDRGGLRFHPRCPWGIETAPCLLARYTDAVTAEPRGIWRRPITGAKPKSLGLQTACVVRLWPDAEVTTGLFLGEGIETTLSAATRITHKGTLLQPAWASGCAGNMAAFPPLNGVESLTLLVDHDAESHAGETASEACARAWIDAGKEVLRIMPKLPGDFNDLVKP